MEPCLDEGIRSFLRERLGSWDRLEPLAGDASTRAYWRVRGGDATWVLCLDSAFKGSSAEEYPYVVVYRILRGTVPVPEIIAMDGNRGLFLIEDLGDALLETVFPDLGSENAGRIYVACIENLFKIQSIRGKGTVPFTLSFDIQKLMYEFDFFIEHALGGHFRAPLGEGDLRNLRAEFLKISEILYRPELFVLAHRDYHSRNIIIRNDTPYIIDFQDARMGLPQYDLASLLRDSYTLLDDDAFDRLAGFYYDGAVARGIVTMGRDEFDRYFDLMAFQRNVKAIGTFGYQSTRLGRRRYAGHIGPTARYLGGYVSRRKELARAWGIVKPHLDGA